MEGKLVMGIMENRSLANLEANPYAVFFTGASAPGGLHHPGLAAVPGVQQIDREGPVLAQ